MAWTSAPNAAAINAAVRAGQFAQASRSSRQPEDERGRARPIDQLSLPLLQLQSREMSLRDLVRGSGLDEGDIAA
jgi:hypothetical protein